VSASGLTCNELAPKSIELANGQRWQFFTERCERIEATIWDMSARSPDGARRVHLREDDGISWEALDAEMLNDPRWTLLSSPGDKR
jgi:hypothetical protein